MINRDNLSCEVKVESYSCTCRGPDLPHEHYFIRWDGLTAGENLEIGKKPSKHNEYYLKIV